MFVIYVVRLFSIWSQMTSKSGENKKVADEAIAECVADVQCSCPHILTSFVSIMKQKHGNMESICFVW